jgi:hypothetical protein
LRPLFSGSYLRGDGDRLPWKLAHTDLANIIVWQAFLPHPWTTINPNFTEWLTASRRIFITLFCCIAYENADQPFVTRIFGFARVVQFSSRSRFVYETPVVVQAHIRNADIELIGAILK